MRRFLMPLVGFVVALACSVEADDDGGPDATCTPGLVFACNCVDGSPGTATCGLDGVPGVCICAAATDGTTAAGTDSTATAGPTEGSDDGCETDCGDTTAAGTSADTGPCAEIFAGTVDTVTVPWSFSGQMGLAAGTAMCASIGADHVCDYEEVLQADQAGEFDGMVNVTAWIHRTTIEEVDAVPSAPGPGGRCVDWTDGTGTLADGEWVEFGADGLVYNLDPDTFYDGIDGSHTDPLFPCMTVSRALLCCNPAC